VNLPDIQGLEQQEVQPSVFVRTFSAEIDEEELKWHWDEEDRWVEPLEPNDWKFQFDDQLPQSIDRPIFIPKGVFHRVIKGTTDLVLRITT